MSEETITQQPSIITERKTTNELFKALCGFHKDCPEIPKNSTSFHGPYANIDDINTIINPLLSKHGLFISHEPHSDNYLTTRVFHTSGGYLESTYPVFIKRNNDSQAWGSAITYAKRYATVAMLNLVVGDPDDDGNRQNNYATNKTKEKSPPKKSPPRRKSKAQLMKDVEREAAKVAAETNERLRKKAEAVKPMCPRPEWEAMDRTWNDTERVRFQRAIKEKNIGYDELKDALYKRGLLKPSSMEREKRIKLLKLLQAEGLKVIERLTPDAKK